MFNGKLKDSLMTHIGHINLRIDKLSERILEIEQYTKEIEECLVMGRTNIIKNGHFTTIQVSMKETLQELIKELGYDFVPQDNKNFKLEKVKPKKKEKSKPKGCDNE